MPTRLLIYDDRRGDFGPLTDRRAAFSVRTGALNNRVRIEVALGIMAADLIVDPALAPVYRAHETDAWVNQPLRREQPIRFHVREDDGEWSPVELAGDNDALLINGRWTGASVEAASVISGLPVGAALRDVTGGTVAARLAIGDAQSFVDQGCAALPEGTTIDALSGASLLTRPWHILDQLESTLAFDLAMFDNRIAPSATVHPSAVIVEDKGPVVVDEHAAVQPLAVLEGPCYIGRHALVGAHTHLRPNSTLGRYVRVGGEVSYSLIDDYSNKAHGGYLGHSLVGQWCNLGAGTTVSNLKNTYGPVRVDLGEGPQDTDRTFQGPILGDFVRTAIGTRILTGSCVGTGSCLAASVYAPKRVPPFRFITDAGDAAYDIDKFIASARIAMARRDQTLGDADESLLRSLTK